jgi:Protein of unknown function (DUF3422)
LFADALSGTSYAAHRLGFITFDSRGVILYCPAHDKDKFCSTPFHIKRRQPLRRSLALEPRETFDDESAVDHTDAALPFLGAVNRTDDPRLEYTASRFLDNRIIYITSLGAEHIDAIRTSVPMKFLILSRPYHRWQIGRLIDRLFAVGSVRTAAIMNLRMLLDASYALRALSHDLQQVRSTTIPYNTLLTTFLELKSRTAALGNNCDGGISYRIERSRYYVSQYRNLENTFRMSRVEGFQQASDFVRRRLFSTFAMIDRIGIRLQAHHRELAELAEDIEIVRARNDDTRNRRYLRKLLELQITGELALIIILTFYSGEIGEKIFRDIHHNSYLHLELLATFAFIFFCIVGFHIRTLRRIPNDKESTN